MEAEESVGENVGEVSGKIIVKWKCQLVCTIFIWNNQWFHT